MLFFGKERGRFLDKLEIEGKRIVGQAGFSFIGPGKP
jgi:hypothetical protein